jgi:hypothetical protein
MAFATNESTKSGSSSNARRVFQHKMMIENVLHSVDCHAREARMKFYTKFQEPKLFIMAKRFDYEGIIRRCQQRPKQASREANFRHAYPPEQAPLHRVLEPYYLLFDGAGADGGISEEWKALDITDELLQRRDEAARALFNACEDAAMFPCSFGTTPLVMICLDPHGNIDMAKNLIARRPKCIAVKDMEGRTPLHNACLIHRNCNEELIDVLLKEDPSAASVIDCHGRTPLHYACIAVIETEEGDPFAGYNQLVAYQSLRQGLPSRCLLQRLLRADPSAASIKNETTKTPIHYLCEYAIKNHIDESELRPLLEVFPEIDGVSPSSFYESMKQAMTNQGIRGAQQ